MAIDNSQSNGLSIEQREFVSLLQVTVAPLLSVIGMSILLIQYRSGMPLSQFIIPIFAFFVLGFIIAAHGVEESLSIKEPKWKLLGILYLNSFVLVEVPLLFIENQTELVQSQLSFFALYTSVVLLAIVTVTLFIFEHPEIDITLENGIEVDDIEQADD